MTKQRDKKQQKQQSKSAAIVRSMMKVIGVEKEFNTLRKSYQEAVSAPSPSIKIHNGGLESDLYEGIVKTVRDHWKRKEVDPGLSVDSLIRYMPPVRAIWMQIAENDQKQYRVRVTEAERAAAIRARPIVNAWMATKAKEIVELMESTIQSILAAYNDEYKVRCYFKRHKEERLVYTLYCLPLESQNIVIRGERRRAFAISVAYGGIEPKDLTYEDQPLFIVDHAIRRYQERLDQDWFKGIWSVLIMLGLMSDPIKRPDGTVLIPCILPDTSGSDRGVIKLGYFIAEKCEQGWVIMTFLFLTMDGSPEFSKLREKLRMSRLDVDYHKLDRLSTFLETDLLSDPRVSKIFDEIGLNVSRISSWIKDSEVKVGWASDFAKYFRLK